MAISLNSLRRRSVQRPPIMILYGTRGCGKTTLACGAPDPILLAVEDGVGRLDVPHWQTTTYTEVMEALGVLASEDHDRKTLVVDSLDRLEPQLWQATCARNNWASLESPGYGKGYLAAMEEWREYLAAIHFLRDERGMMVIQIAHEVIRRFDSPETEPYDRYQMKLHDRASALLQEDADAVLFQTYRVSTTKSDVGFNQKVTRAIGGGNRVIYTEERPAYLAKNRMGLPSSIDLPAVAGATDNPQQVWSAFAKHVPETTEAEAVA